jgi:hypothetical protein
MLGTTTVALLLLAAVLAAESVTTIKLPSLLLQPSSPAGATAGFVTSEPLRSRMDSACDGMCDRKASLVVRNLHPQRHCCL